jgi:hypothetical protein
VEEALPARKTGCSRTFCGLVILFCDHRNYQRVPQHEQCHSQYGAAARAFSFDGGWPGISGIFGDEPVLIAGILKKPVRSIGLAVAVPYVWTLEHLYFRLACSGRTAR